MFIIPLGYNFRFPKRLFNCPGNSRKARPLQVAHSSESEMQAFTGSDALTCVSQAEEEFSKEVL